MKKAFVEFISIFVAGCLFFSCNPSTGDDSGEEIQQQQEQQQQQENSEKTEKDDKDSVETVDGENKPDDKEDTTPAVNRKIGVTFNISGAQALAKLESEKTRAAASSRLGDLVKIMSDGSMEDAVFVEENCELSDIVSIYKSPLEDSDEVFLVMDGESKIGYEEVEKEYDGGGTYKEKTNIKIGQLIGLLEDGSINDILKKEDATDPENSHMFIKTDSVTFDKAGNLYFISSGIGNMIYQYNPKTAKLTQMVAAVENTTYERMQIDDEGQWIFVSGYRSSTSFLRAIPISNPNSPINIYYSSGNTIESEKWAYDNKNGIMYFIVYNGQQSGLFTAAKADGFNNPTWHALNVGQNFDVNLFETFYGVEDTLYWHGNYKTNGVFDSAKIVQYLIQSAQWFFDRKTGEQLRITKDDVDIRFDKYASTTGKLKALAVLTAGKKNEEAFEALNNHVGLSAFHNFDGDAFSRQWFAYDSSEEGYKHNFLADILYVKDTDTLLVDDDKVYFEYLDYVYDENGDLVTDGSSIQYQLVSVKGSDIVRQKSNGLYKDNRCEMFVACDRAHYVSTMYSFATRFYEQNTSSSYYKSNLNATAILDELFGYCNVDGVKEFRLTTFQNDEKYGALYSTLKNEEAIKWIASDPERLNLFGQLFDMDYSYNTEIQAYDTICVYYPAFMYFISQTCFIAGTDEKAVTWNWKQNKEISEVINYDYSRSGPPYGKLSATDTGVYYEYYNTTGDDPFYFIVQVADADGKFVELVNKLPLPSGKVVKSEKNKDRILLQYSMTNENGAELGYHHIYSVEMSNGVVTNCFDNVPNRNNLEVITFNSAGNLLYYSAVRGTLVENGIVNLVTNEYTALDLQRKMVAVYTFN